MPYGKFRSPCLRPLFPKGARLKQVEANIAARDQEALTAGILAGLKSAGEIARRFLAKILTLE